MKTESPNIKEDREFSERIMDSNYKAGYEKGFQEGQISKGIFTTSMNRKVCYESGYKKAIEEFEKLIDKIERIDWDCNLPCGVVNGNTDKCKKCGKRKEESLDNSKLEELKQKLGEEK